MAASEHRPSIQVPDVLPVLPLRDTVVYPMTVTPLVVGQERALRLLDDVMRSNRLAALVAQRDPSRTVSSLAELHEIGTMVVVHEIARGRDQTARVAVQGLERIRLVELVRTDPYLVARVAAAPEQQPTDVEVDALARAARDLFVRLVALAPELSDDLATVAQRFTDARQLIYLVASSMPLPTDVRQDILALDSVAAKLRRIIELLQREISVRELSQRIAAETRTEMSRREREYVLREQMKAIQRELGEAESPGDELRDLRKRIAETPLGDEARREAERELARLERIPDASPEHGMVESYLDWLLKLPWGRTSGAPIDVGRARQTLDEDHYDLEPIKDRILEHLAVKRLREERRQPESTDATETAHEPILCFVGPPGVGKTSLGQSIARAMGRRFVRMSLGGIHDEAEIRGHRRTYIGSMPGRIVQSLVRAGTADPIFMLDEVDKLGVGFHGDPAAALLEVLDPAQNHAFVDTYLGVPFDLSRVLFVCTANTTDTIPAPLLDRMEVLRLSGYTDTEKLHIAERYLVPKQLAASGLRPGEVTIDPDAILRVVREYTREAGVRNLERELGSILRKVARRITEGAQPPIQVHAGDVPQYLGAPRLFAEVAERLDRPGVATGLAWTPTGGDVLFVEAAMMPSITERLILTGMLGSVMRESARAALSYLRSNAERFGLDPLSFHRQVVHIHVPAGAIPKDGPSAGVTMFVALASEATGRLVRSDVAMTGEITLRGKILPVGGIKEKVLAAHRAGIRTVILPARNQAALADVPEEVRREIRFVLAESVDEVLADALAPDARPHAAAPPPTEPPPLH